MRESTKTIEPEQTPPADAFVVFAVICMPPQASGS